MSDVDSEFAIDLTDFVEADTLEDEFWAKEETPCCDVESEGGVVDEEDGDDDGDDGVNKTLVVFVVDARAEEEPFVDLASRRGLAGEPDGGTMSSIDTSSA